jgi:hypothetical protein
MTRSKADVELRGYLRRTSYQDICIFKICCACNAVALLASRLEERSPHVTLPMFVSVKAYFGGVQTVFHGTMGVHMHLSGVLQAPLLYHEIGKYNSDSFGCIFCFPPQSCGDFILSVKGE